MQRFFSLLLPFLLVPSIALAAQPSAENLVSRLATETKPTNFTSQSVRTTREGSETRTVKGAWEGKGPTKAWAVVTINRRNGSDWLMTEVELRAKGGTVYAKLNDVRGSEPGAASTLRPLLGTWYVLGSLQSDALRALFSPQMRELVSSVSFIGDAPVRFKDGQSYSFSVTSGDGRMKVDTALDGAFRFVSLHLSSNDGGDATTVDVKAQRQFSTVPVETPKKAVTVERSPLFDLLVGTSTLSNVAPVLPAVTPVAAPVTAPAVTAPGVNHDVSTEMTLPPLVDPVQKRLSLRQADRAIANIVTAEGKNVKLTVRVVNAPVTWSSVADFRADFTADNGILFVYQQPILPAFSTRGAFGPLDIAFFDAAGNFVSSAEMDRCFGNSCPFYTPTDKSLTALQMRAGSLKRYRIGALSRLTFDRYDLREKQRTSDRARIDRAARNRRELLSTARQPVRTSGVDLSGYEKIVTLVKNLAAQVRPADVREAQFAASPLGNDATRALYFVLKQAQQKNADVTYVDLLVPQQGTGFFTLLVDSFTYMPLELLDSNHNGKLDPEEAPEQIGSPYYYPLFEDAMKGVTIDTSYPGETSAYAPILDGEGNAIAILGVTQRVTGSSR